MEAARLQAGRISRRDNSARQFMNGNSTDDVCSSEDDPNGCSHAFDAMSHQPRCLIRPLAPRYCFAQGYEEWGFLL